MPDDQLFRYVRDTIPFADSVGSAVDATPHLRSIVMPTLETPATQALTAAIWASGQPLAIHVGTHTTLPRLAGQLAAGLCMPVGDFAFVRRCMEIAEIPRPPWKCYPEALKPHMHHLPRGTSVSGALRWPKPIFVRPAVDKTFRGFVLQADAGKHTPEDLAQLDTLLSMDRRERVWVATPLAISSTWRYFVLGGELLGYHRIQGAADPEPDPGDVSAIIAALPLGQASVLDFAVLASGATSLLRTRDPWGLEYPEAASPTAPSPMDFLRLLWTRWAQVTQGARPANSRWPLAA